MPSSLRANGAQGFRRASLTHEVAHGVLASHLQSGLRWLPLAAEKSEEDVEYVHQLRIASRRAVAALRTFAELIPADACGKCGAVAEDPRGGR